MAASFQARITRVSKPVSGVVCEHQMEAEMVIASNRHEHPLAGLCSIVSSTQLSVKIYV